MTMDDHIMTLFIYLLKKLPSFKGISLSSFFLSLSLSSSLESQEKKNNNDNVMAI
jgi:hypothetical protein